MPLLHASALSFVWPKTVSCHFGLLAFACMAVFGVEQSIIRCDDSILSHSTSFEASNSAFLTVASRSGISQHGSYMHAHCLVAWESFHCSALLVFIVLAVLYLGIFLFFTATRGSCFYVSWLQLIIM